MTQSDPVFYRSIIDRHCRQVADGAITPDEFAAAILQKLSDAPMDDLSGLAAVVAAAAPASARAALVRACDETLRPGFRHGAWHRGGPDSRTDAELEQESALITARFREWAVRLAAALNERLNPTG